MDALAADSIQQTNLVLRPRAGSQDRIYWDAQWRVRTSPSKPWRLKKQRLGLAWLEPDGAGGWRKRRGRCPAGVLDQRAAHLAADRAMQEHARRLLGEQERKRRSREQSATVRGLAVEWLGWLEQVRGAKPSTIRDCRTLLREPGEPYKRGQGVSRGLIMKTFGEKLAADVSTKGVSDFLRSLDADGLTLRNVNKYRQVLQAMFAYACRSDTFGLAARCTPCSQARASASTSSIS